MPRAHTQSTDAVHVSPLKAGPSDQPRSAPAIPVGNEQSRHWNVKPLQVDVNLVLVPVTVTDSANRPVIDLEKDQFMLYEGDQHQQIRYFSSEETPISLGVILDLSKSMRDKIDDARQAVAEFFEAAHPQDDYFVVTFSDRPEVLADVTRSIGTIRAKLASTIPSGHTALLDAIYLGISKMRSARYQRRALLIISDGGDNRSRYRASELKRIVQEADVGIYALGIFGRVFTTPEEWMGKRLLTDITEATGGRTITLNNSRELPAMAAALSRELRSQYVLGYRPSNPLSDGKWRKIQVRLSPSSGVEPRHVHAKKGYFAPAQ